MWTSTNKKFYLFLGIIFFIGFIAGILYYFLISHDNQLLLQTSIKNFLANLNTIRINSIGLHLLILPVLIIGSFLFIGIPLCIIFLFYNGFLLGFILCNFVICMGIKGLLFGIIYVIITKVIYLFFLLILIISLLKISINFFKYLVKKANDRKEKIIFLFKRVMICFLIIILNDGLLYFIGGKFINIFNFLLI